MVQGDARSRGSEGATSRPADRGSPVIHQPVDSRTPRDLLSETTCLFFGIMDPSVPTPLMRRNTRSQPPIPYDHHTTQMRFVP
jgi:hypothetical protein